jgi:hypothetical protein
MTVQDFIDMVREYHIPMDAVLDSVDTIIYSPNDTAYEIAYDVSKGNVNIRSDKPIVQIFQTDLEAIVNDIPDMSSETEYYKAVTDKVTVTADSNYWKARVDRTIRAHIKGRIDET